MNIANAEHITSNCRLTVHPFRKQSFDKQSNTFGLIDVYNNNTEKYLGSIPLWWSDSMLDKANNVHSSDHLVFRITVNTPEPMYHLWTYEDYRKGLCKMSDIDKEERLPDGTLKVYKKISFLFIFIFDNETREIVTNRHDVEDTYKRIVRWCYRRIKYN